MKLIHIPNSYEQNLIENLVFDLEDFHNYKLVPPDQAQVFMLSAPISLPDGNPELIIIYDWFNFCSLDHNWISLVKQKYQNSEILLISAMPNQKVLDVKCYFYDIMFNRTKAYYTQFPFKILQNKRDHPWYYAGQDSYKINLNLTQTLPGDCVDKVFIFCTRNRSYNNGSKQNPVRYRISKHLEQYQHLGYYFTQDCKHDTLPSEIGLLSGMDDPLINGEHVFNIDNGCYEKNNIEGPLFFRGTDYFRGYAPVHVNYYNKSMITFTAESLEVSDITVSEKTYDPMIHGHLVMPFGAPGLVEHCKNLGWKFANFIDFSYDALNDQEQRTLAYLHELDRLLTIDIEDWKDLYKKNIDVVNHNQRKFWVDSYYKITHLL